MGKINRSDNTKKGVGDFISHPNSKCLPKYVSYDWISVYIEGRSKIYIYIDRLQDVKMDFTPSSMQSRKPVILVVGPLLFMVKRCSPIAESIACECPVVNRSIFKIPRGTCCLTLISKRWLVRPVYVYLHMYDLYMFTYI